MNSLIHGYIRFRSHNFPLKRRLFAKLAEGQSPQYLFITCCDSRVTPHDFTGAGPGDMFHERSLGNVVPAAGGRETEAPAVIEYAVQALNVKHIIVCGHTQCGAIKAMLDPDSLAGMPNVAAWLASAGDARAAVARKYGALEGDELLNATIRENVLVQLDHVRSQPSVAPRLAEGRLQVHGWVFEFEHGRVLAHDPRVDRFVPLIDAYAGRETSV
jgi:carbonic anhydrase